MKDVKEMKGGNLLLDILNSIKSGQKTRDIKKNLNLSNQLFSYYTRRLIKKGLIKKIGYGTYETSKTSSRVAEIRGHGFLWKVKHKPINWIKRLNELNIKYKLLSNKIPSILFHNRKIWLCKNTIIIYEPESFLGINAIEVRKYAVNRLIEVLEALERKLDINLKPYEFQVKRQHYSIIKNSLAIQCNKLGQKIQIFNEKGLWFIIDNSFNLNECEQVHPETALIDNLGIQKYFNSHKNTQFKVTPEFILESFNKMFAINDKLEKQINSHLKLIQEYRKENIRWRNGQIKEIKENIGQTKLGDYL